MKGIDYEETNTYRAFYLFDTPIRKIGFCPERDSNPRLPDYYIPFIASKSLTCVLSPVWGYRGRDIHSSEEKLGPGNPHVAKVAPLICCVASVVALMV